MNEIRDKFGDLLRAFGGFCAPKRHFLVHVGSKFPCGNDGLKFKFKNKDKDRLAFVRPSLAGTTTTRRGWGTRMSCEFAGRVVFDD